ncbi:hypothetical protein [Streptomyces sp. NPDC056452]|uniref:hypothetical protein n=1 Tax=Streptomyces sp. NPDC056452 TaxID=3345821 RepID=UPI0036D06E84
MIVCFPGSCRHRAAGCRATTAPISESWTLIENWLAEHAPATNAAPVVDEEQRLRRDFVPLRGDRPPHRS